MANWKKEDKWPCSLVPDLILESLSLLKTEGGFHFGEGQKRTFPKAFLALSRDDGTVRVHRDSDALCRCKSGTGPSPGITSASPGIVLVIAALDYIICSMSRGNDDARERCARFISYFARPGLTTD